METPGTSGYHLCMSVLCSCSAFLTAFPNLCSLRWRRQIFAHSSSFFSAFHMHQSWRSCLLSLLQSPMGPVHLFVYEQFVLPEVFSPSQVLRPVSHLFLKADTEGWFTMLFTGISSFPGAFQLSLGSLRYESRLALSLFVKTCTPHWFLPQLLVLKTCLQISMHLQRWKNWQQKSSSSSGWPTFTLMISYSSTSQGADLQEFYPCKLK